MAKFLRIDPHENPKTGGIGGLSYQLPDEVDIDRLTDQIAEALAGGDSLKIPLNRLNDTTPTEAYIVINCSLVRQILVGNAPDDRPAKPRPGGSSRGEAKARQSS